MVRRGLAVLGTWVLVTSTGCGKVTERYLARARAAASADAGAVRVPTEAPSATASFVAQATPPPAPPKERREVTLLRRHLPALREIVARGKPSEAADAQQRCEEIEAARRALLNAATPEVTAMLGEASRACGFDVPLLAAREALAQLDRPGSQASVMLACRVANEQLAKARVAKPGHFAVRTEDARMNQLCAK